MHAFFLAEPLDAVANRQSKWTIYGKYIIKINCILYFCILNTKSTNEGKSTKWNEMDLIFFDWIFFTFKIFCTRGGYKLFDFLLQSSMYLFFI